MGWLSWAFLPRAKAQPVGSGALLSAVPIMTCSDSLPHVASRGLKPRVNASVRCDKNVLFQTFVLFASISLCPSDRGLSGDPHRGGDLGAHCRLCVPRLGPQGHQQRFPSKVSLGVFIPRSLCLSPTHCFPPAAACSRASQVSRESSGQLYTGLYKGFCLTKSL